MLAIYKTRLERENFKVITAREGFSGTHMALAEKPHLILLDLMMPEADGKDVLSTLQISKHGKDIPVMIVSNLNPGDIDLSRYKSLVVDYLVKTSYTPAQIVERVKGFFEQTKQEKLIRRSYAN